MDVILLRVDAADDYSLTLLTALPRDQLAGLRALVHNTHYDILCHAERIDGWAEQDAGPVMPAALAQQLRADAAALFELWLDRDGHVIEAELHDAALRRGTGYRRIAEFLDATVPDPAETGSSRE